MSYLPSQYQSGGPPPPQYGYNNAPPAAPFNYGGYSYGQPAFPPQQQQQREMIPPPPAPSVSNNINFGQYGSSVISSYWSQHPIRLGSPEYYQHFPAAPAYQQPPPLAPNSYPAPRYEEQQPFAGGYRAPFATSSYSSMPPQYDIPRVGYNRPLDYPGYFPARPLLPSFYQGARQSFIDRPPPVFDQRYVLTSSTSSAPDQLQLAPSAPRYRNDLVERYLRKPRFGYFRDEEDPLIRDEYIESLLRRSPPLMDALPTPTAAAEPIQPFLKAEPVLPVKPTEEVRYIDGLDGSQLFKRNVLSTISADSSPRAIGDDKKVIRVVAESDLTFLKGTVVSSVPLSRRTTEADQPGAEGAWA